MNDGPLSNIHKYIFSILTAVFSAQKAINRLKKVAAVQFNTM